LVLLSQDIGIDLGTTNVLVHVQGKGIVLREPCVVAYDLVKKRVHSIGESAREMIGRTPPNIAVVQPMEGGVIANYTVAVQMLEYIFQKVCGARRLFKPRVLMAIPSDATGVQARSFRQAALEAGAASADTIDEAMAAALGADLPIDAAAGNMIVDIGGGTTDIAVISLDGIVISRNINVGGATFDDAIARHVKTRYNISIGERTAEEIKIAIGSAAALRDEKRYEMRGRDLVSGLPESVILSSEEVRDALADPLAQIVQRIKQVLEKTPPELVSDIIDQGITLTGGSALLTSFNRLIQHTCHVPTRVAPDPLSCVIVGIGRALAENRGIMRGTSPSGS
jgi:rod shape-determining protein MreB